MGVDVGAEDLQVQKGVVPGLAVFVKHLQAHGLIGAQVQAGEGQAQEGVALAKLLLLVGVGAIGHGAVGVKNLKNKAVAQAVILGIIAGIQAHGHLQILCALQVVNVLYLDAPVMNLLSCPAGIGVGKSDFLPEFIRATGMSLSQLTYYREHPIDKLPLLVKNNIPIIMVYGDSDDIVPYCDNGAILEKYYRENDGIIETIGKENCGHHPHGLDDNTPIIEFIEKYSI